MSYPERKHIECRHSYVICYRTGPFSVDPTRPSSVSVKKTGEGETGRVSNIVRSKGSGKDPRATGGFVAEIPYLLVNKWRVGHKVGWQQSGNVSLLGPQ